MANTSREHDAREENPVNTDENKPVTAADVARHFGVSVATVRRWVRQGRVPFIRPSRKVTRFHISDVEAALAGGVGVPRDQ
jgi:excisionase family DNA binding protein